MTPCITAHVVRFVELYAAHIRLGNTLDAEDLMIMARVHKMPTPLHLLGRPS